MGRKKIPQVERPVKNSCIPSFHKLSVPERVRAIRDRGLISQQDYKNLLAGRTVLSVDSAGSMIENVVGVMGLPIGLGLNFQINQKDYVVPMAVEEPSIVAAVSFAAKTVRSAGGFETSSTEPILIGQIQVVDVPHPSQARAKLLQRKEEVLNLADSLHPRLVARGGGARDLEVFLFPAAADSVEMLVVHLLVDTRDAMGANLVNTMCEGVASLVEGITGGKVFLRILSNLADRSLVRARMRVPVQELTSNGFDGEQVRDGIIIAGGFANVDPYRAATHNKGIMNGIDAVALATGNDWRAVEAGAHAYAARGSHYTSLTRWYKDDAGCLVGEIELPLKVGTVGGSLESNPTVDLNLRLLNVESARELAEVMGAVGLAQNFAALRALATEGIQQGHMTLHARSVVTAAGAPPELFDTVVERVVASGEIKVWKATELIHQVRAESVSPVMDDAAAQDSGAAACGHGKIILFGEHAVVYGSRAIAAPVPPCPAGGSSSACKKTRRNAARSRRRPLWSSKRWGSVTRPCALRSTRRYPGPWGSGGRPRWRWRSSGRCMRTTGSTSRRSRSTSSPSGPSRWHTEHRRGSTTRWPPTGDRSSTGPVRHRRSRSSSSPNPCVSSSASPAMKA